MVFYPLRSKEENSWKNARPALLRRSPKYSESRACGVFDKACEYHISEEKAKLWCRAVPAATGDAIAYARYGAEGSARLHLDYTALFSAGGSLLVTAESQGRVFRARVEYFDTMSKSSMPKAPVGCSPKAAAGCGP